MSGHQNAFGARTPLRPAGGAYSAPPDALDGLKGEKKEIGEGSGKGERRGRGKGK